VKNPVSYTLKPNFTVTDVNLIFDSMRRRARAAFTYHWNMAVSTGNDSGLIATKLKNNAQAIEIGLAAAWETARTWADRKVEIVRFATDVDKERFERAQKLVSDWKGMIKSYEADCFRKARGNKMIRFITTKRESTWKEDVAYALNTLRRAYPFVSIKNRPRLARALRKALTAGTAKYGRWDQILKNTAVFPNDLLAEGIPAAEIAGPWWTKTKTIKRPMDWVERGILSEKDLARARSSPTILNWVGDIGLDSGDHTLVHAVEVYYSQHRSPPSVEWARRRNNEIEEERTQKDLEDQLPQVEAWLESSDYWRRSEDVTVPPMPDPTFRVLRQGDGELLCHMAKRDGLCVVDSVIDAVNDISWAKGEGAFTEKLFLKAKREGFVTLIISTDQKRRTVVGLNEHGFCTSEHHCTGIQNKVDAVAYEYFKKH
jgi:hypothetical protein